MRPARRTGRRGFALLMALAHVALLTAFWGLANRQTAALLGLHAALRDRDQRARGALVALARGVALLETGPPPSDPYRARVGLETPAGHVDYGVQFASAGPGRWSVAVAPLAAGDVPPDLPASFGP